jgi:DNA-binding FrmR family transcriptional regulator
MSKNPSHKEHISRLNRAKGQIEAIGKMIEEGRYCVDIITQVRAARSALKRVELDILETHMGTCVLSAAASKDEKKKAEKIAEVMNILKKYE